MRPVVLLNFDSLSLAARVESELPLIVAAVSRDDCADSLDRVVGLVTDRVSSWHRDSNGIAMPVLLLSPATPPNDARQDNARWFSPTDLASAIQWFADAIDPATSRITDFALGFAAAVGLTDAETRAFQLLVSGHNTQSSAQRLGLSVRSIEHQHLAIRRKANVATIAGALSQFACFCVAMSDASESRRASTDRVSGVALTPRTRFSRAT